jgi:hypothetical protein
MTKYELKEKVQATGIYFFERDSLRFFGDTMKNYGVRSAVVDTYTQVKIDCWELYRIHPVKNWNQKSTYFRKSDFERVYPKIN